MAKEKNMCSGYNKPDAAGMSGMIFIGAMGRELLKCDYEGKYFERGKYWCGIHAPSKVKAREEAKEERERQKWAKLFGNDQ